MATILTLDAREILDSRGNPTVEVEVTVGSGIVGRAAVPSGASTGTLEAVELRDRDEHRYGGKGVLKAVENIKTTISDVLVGQSCADQAAIDHRLIALDGTPNKSRLGANAMLGVSLACARAAAASQKLPLYRYLAHGKPVTLPVPMFNVFNGGAHANNSVAFQEFMLAPVGAPNFREALRMGAECYHVLKKYLGRGGYATSVGDEGGFASDVSADGIVLELLAEAIHLAGYELGKHIVFCLDPAASEFSEKKGHYDLDDVSMKDQSSDEMIALYGEWLGKFSIWSIEDGLAEDDWIGWKTLTKKLGDKIQLVGDDIFCTNPGIISKAIKEKVANAALIKLNQIGTLTETMDAIAVARMGKYGTVISHRSGETWDDFIADFAVGMGAGQIKTGAPCRGERLAKYNRLARIEEELGSAATYAGQIFSANGGFLHG